MGTDGTAGTSRTTPLTGTSTGTGTGTGNGTASTRATAGAHPSPTSTVRSTQASPRRHLADGRVARGRQTRRALVEAVVELVDEGDSSPTPIQAAARAGVSVRLVYHHFRGMDRLLLAAVAFQSDRHRTILFAIPPRGTPELRIQALCRQRRLYFEEMTPIYRVAHARPQVARGLRDLLADDRTALRQQLSDTLGPEVGAHDGSNEALLDALEHATGWEAWRSLRDTHHHSAPSAERAMGFAARRLLG